MTISASHDELDDDTLAAFLDGTLDPEERSAVLAKLASNPDAYSAFLEASQITAELATRPVLASPRRWRRAITLAGPLLAAASIVAVVLWNRGEPPADTIDFVQQFQKPTLSGTGSIEAAFGSNWDAPGWAVVRGSDIALSTRGVAVRSGARFAQLEYAAQAEDILAADVAREALAQLLTSINGAGPIIQTTRSVDASRRGATDRATLARQVRSIAGASAAFDLGAWLETARLAMMSGGATLGGDGALLVALVPVIAALERDVPAGQWDHVLDPLRSLMGSDQLSVAAASRAIDLAVAALPK